jgi:hypothetical protein
MENCSFKDAKITILGTAYTTILSPAEVDEAHNLLLSKKYVLDILRSMRGWEIPTIVKFKLGWSEKEKRVFIPVYNEKNELVNIRKYLVNQKSTDSNPKFKGVKGHNSVYFFPIKNLIENEHICLCAGEPDTILACQLGIVAGTFTAGEGAINRNLLPLFKDKLVYMCYDKDLEGIKFVKAVMPQIVPYAKQVKRIDLPFEP